LSIAGVITIRPCTGSVADRYSNATSMLATPAGTSSLNAYTSSGSRVHAMRWPLAVMTKPASLLIGPLGEWLPGSHCGYSRVSGPACTGIFSLTRKMRCERSVASTWIAIVPGAYGVSTGGAVCAWATVGDIAASANSTAAVKRVMRGCLRSG
jgi:hypothetical protein